MKVFSKVEHDVGLHWYSIKLEIRGPFPSIGCNYLYEDYCMIFRKMETAITTAKELGEALVKKGWALGEVSYHAEPVVVRLNPAHEEAPHLPMFVWGK